MHQKYTFSKRATLKKGYFKEILCMMIVCITQIYHNAGLDCESIVTFVVIMNQNDRTDNQEIVNWLKEHFPKAFKTKRHEVRPLQLGVMESLLDFFERLSVQPFSKKRLRQGLNFYTSTNAYLRAQKEGVYRIDIFGEEVDKVDASQAEYAQEKLQSRQSKKEPDEPKVNQENKTSSDTQEETP